MRSDLVLLALQRATHASLQVLGQELVDLDLTPAELNCLANLADGQGRTVSEVGAAVGIRPTTLTGVLDRLENRGHLTRGVHAGDRRAVRIELTEAGREVAELIHDAMRDFETRALEQFSARDIEKLRAMLQALTDPSSE